MTATTDLFAHGYALLIGVDENRVPEWALPDVAKDVAALAGVLLHPQRAAYSRYHVRAISGKEATRGNILAGLEWLQGKLAADGSENQTALVYFSGHGWQDNALAQPAYYLIPYDVQPTRLRQTALRADDFAAAVAELAPRRLLVLLDCCHAGGIAVKGVEAGSLAPFSLPPAWLMGGQPGAALAPGSKGLDAGLLAQGQGRAVLNSSRSDERSYLLRDRTMSIFTYHLIAALTGHAPHAAEDREVTAADLLSYVWRRVPETAQAEWGLPQHPDGQISGNFPVALLLGGEGAGPGKALPDPREPLPEGPAPAGRAAFDQRGQTVHGPQTNIGGDVHGPVFSGAFHGPVQVGGGSQVSVGDIREVSGGTVNIAGGDIVQRMTRSDHSITVGDITNSSGVAIGHGARATVTGSGGGEAEAMARAFGLILRQVDRLEDALAQEEAREALAKLEGEARKGEQPDEGRVRRALGALLGMSEDIFEVAVATFTSPVYGLSTAFRKIVARAGEERAGRGRHG